MLTKDDKKFILDTITFAITKNNKIVEKRFDIIDKRFDSMDKRFDSMDKKIDLLDKSLGKLSEETVELFTITNKRLEEVNQNLGDKIDAINGVIVNHEHRIEKVEEKVFITTTSS
ncbi:conserved hypothetical protein [Candidatus Roizmanbacteria bacterium]|nr:conserved hypothetical protein [Candidatus Roizmanbacteria bacterium]